MELKQVFEFLLETLKLSIFAFLIVFPIRYFVFQPFLVSGSSMFPNFEDHDYLLVDEISFRFREPERGEVIVFRAPAEPSSRYIKRVIGLPNETVEIRNGVIFISNDNGTESLNESEYLSPEVFTSGNLKITLKDGEYFVLGDNRLFSSDSRVWGILPEKNIIGKAFFRALPANNLSLIIRPVYNLSFAF